MTAQMNRRSLLSLGAALGISVNFFGSQAFAASEGDLARKKLVVVICRGGMDGLSVSPPVGDPNYANLRGSIAMKPDQVLRLDDTFGLHPELKTVHALAQKGEARIAPAIASPDRARSHFEAQDVLETGSAHVYGVESGWLNRTLEALAPARKVEGLSVGTTAPLILRGKVQAASWSPGKGVDETARLPTLLQDLYRNDPMLGPAFARGLETETMAQTAMTALSATPAMNVAAASTPATPGAAPMSATMANDRQNRAGSEAARKLGSTLGGALKKGGIIGDWPGLADNALFENRDTAPTVDMRGLFKGVLADHIGVDRAVLESKVFPDSAAAKPVTGLV